jgi:transposase
VNFSSARPPYTPELNPDELAWAHLKTRIAKAETKTKEELKLTVDSALHRLQQLPEIVASFFHAPSCKYAAV